MFTFARTDEVGFLYIRLYDSGLAALRFKTADRFLERLVLSDNRRQHGFLAVYLESVFSQISNLINFAP